MSNFTIFRILPWFSQFLWNVTSLFSGSHQIQSLVLLQMTKYLLMYPASRGYIFTVWAGLRKVASADNCSIFYYACVKFAMPFASKINCQVCPQMVRVLGGIKNCDNSDLLHKTQAMHWNHCWMDLNGCQKRLLFAQQLTQRKCNLCSQGTLYALKNVKKNAIFFNFFGTRFLSPEN